jgi:hypothetical protein
MFQTGHSKVGGRKRGSKNKKTLLGADELLLKLDINPIEKLIDIAESGDASIEQQLLDNELAYEYSGGKKLSWCR